MRRETTDLLSYDYRDLAAAESRAKADTTLAFDAKYEKTFRAGVLPTAQRNKAVSVATATSVSFNAGSCQKPVYILTIEQQVSNTHLRAPRVDRETVKVTVQWTKGRYLIDDVAAM